MKTALSLFTLIAMTLGSFALGHRHGFRTRENHAFDAGRRWGQYERAVFEQKIRASERGSTQPVPGFESEAQNYQARATPPATSYLPAGR